MNLEPDFHHAEPLVPIPLLANLRAFVLGRNQRRCPEWYFRLAEDLVLRIQPRPPWHRYGLFGSAVEGAGITRATVEVLGRFATVSFGIDVTGAAWTLHPYGAGWPAGTVDYPGTARALRARVLAALVPERFAVLRPEMLLWPHCVICGKALTDPVSIAHGIGPECFGSASLAMPWIFAVPEAPSA
jgi:hypothetical protein